MEERKLRTDIPIFENHCHVVFPQPIDVTLAGFEKHARNLGISAFGLLSCPRSGHAAGAVDYLENMKILYIKDRLELPVYTYAGFEDHTADGDAYVRFAEEMLALGFDGFKTLEMHPRNRKAIGKGLCDPSFDPFFDRIGALGMPMVCHVGDPRPSWSVDTASESARQLGRVYGDGHLTLDGLYGEMEHTFEKHPDVRFILAHFYFMSDNHDSLVALMERFPNVYLDLTPGSEMFVNFSGDIALWREFFLRYRRRIILGSDLYGAGHGVARYLLARRFLETVEPFEVGGEPVIPLNLPEDVLRDICRDNALGLLPPVPRPVDRAKAYAACRKIEQDHWNDLDEDGQANLKTFLRFWEPENR